MSLGQPGSAIILLTFAAALLLAVLPLPDTLAIYRPEWVSLVLIYWCLAVPERVGIGMGWSVGLLLDVLTGGLLGQHALAMAVVAFFAIRLHRRVRPSPVWQQALSVLLLVVCGQAVNLWIKGITGTSPESMSFFVPSLVSTLLWPGIFVSLRAVRRRFVTVNK